MCACVSGVYMRGIQYYACIKFLRLYVYIVVDLVKRGVLMLADDIRCYYYYY